MFSWLKKRLSPPEPAGPPVAIREFGTDDGPISQDGVIAEDPGWRIECSGKRTVHLFEVPLEDVEQSLLTYRAQMRCSDLDGEAYLEMWCRLPGRGEFFSKGLDSKLGGTMDWSSFETPFFVRKGQRPDLAKLNLAVKGRGTIWIKEIGLDRTPLVET